MRAPSFGHRLLWVFLVVGAGCTSAKPIQGLAVSLSFAPSSLSQCAKVVVEGGGQRVESTALARLPRSLLVAVHQGGLPDEVELHALGFANAECTGVAIEQTRKVPARFEPGQLGQVALELSADQSCDGGCPSLPENCAVEGDEDLDGKADCQDPDCAALPQCQAPSEVCHNGIDDDGDGLADCLDSDCNAKVCDGGICNAATCLKPATEQICDDQLDDDGDSVADCADPDCLHKKCDDKNVCTTDETCRTVSPNGCGTLSPVCPSPQECWDGVCQGDAGCGLVPNTGSACSGGKSCRNGQCTRPFSFTPTRFTDVAVATQVSPPIELGCGFASFNSTTGVFTTCPGQPTPTAVPIGNAYVLPMASFTLQAGSTLRLAGDKPVVLAVFGDVLIQGHVDVGAQGTAAGAGSTVNCGDAAGNPGQPNETSAENNQTGGGGGGAAHGSSGAEGGDSENGDSGGKPSSPLASGQLRGGCSGGRGGNAGGMGGAGGGALQISASGKIRVEGKISAQGGGGRAPSSAASSGGGGGGSGGLLVLEATLVELAANAALTANGGGGSGGSSSMTIGAAAQNGEDGHTGDAQAAAGGTTHPFSGAGGAGAARNAVAQPGASAQSAPGRHSGGGGGGGLGRIEVLLHGGTCSRDNAAVTSPAAGACN